VIGHKPESTTLVIGGMRVDRAEARAFACRYLDPDTGWAYPAYDGYDSDRARGPLVDADFLAPVLLNVRMSIATYGNLVGVRDVLQEKLSKLPERGLLEATGEDIDRVADLYSVIDAKRTHGARATTLSKVLHRKRPDLIPLYDTQVRRTYMGCPDAPVNAGGRTRSWRQMMAELIPAIQHDLEVERAFYDEVAEYASDPVITPLRALDIIAWWSGTATSATLMAPSS
jgi:hypothetical protein